jgi:lambda family phage tail tape measure protein
MAGTKAQLEFTADASGVKTGVEQAKRSLADLGATAAAEGKKAAAGIDAVAAGAKKTADGFNREEGRLRASIQRVSLDLQTLGKTASEKFEAKISLQGLDSSKFQPYIAQLKALEQAQKAADEALKTAPKSLDKVGVSAAQTAAALRGVPAQFTDIVTSLQGGQAPLTVLLQQGGQLKDMFGGIGPAASALSTYVAGMVNPLTLAAAAVGVLALAYYQATERNNAFNKALIATGNYAGTTAGDLDDYAKKIASTVGTQGQAADALTALANSGKVAGEQLRLVGTAVVAENKAMGTSIEDLVTQYASLADEPVKASAKLNESLHYLTQATYDKIRALDEDGRKEEAAALAQEARAGAAITRMQSIIQQTGLLSKALSGTKDVALGMWNAIAGAIGSIGAQQSSAQKLIDAQRKLSYLTQNGSTPEALASAQGDVRTLSRQALREQDTAFAEGQRSREEAAKISASDRLKTLTDEVRTNAQKRKQAIDDLNRDFKLLGKATTGADYDKLVDNINAKFKDPKGAKDKAEKAFQDDAATKMLQTLRQTEASLADQLDGELRITDAQKKQVEFQQLIADLKDKKVLTADQKSLLASKEAIEAQLQKNVELSNQIDLEKKIAEIQKRSNEDQKAFRQQVKGLDITLASAAQSRSEQYSNTLDTVGLGTRARAEVEAQRSIRKEYEGYKRQLTKEAADKDQLGTDEFTAALAKIDQAREAELEAQKKFFATQKDQRSDWLNGAKEAFANYSDEASNAAKHTEEAFGNALKGVEDQLTSLFTGGKFDGKKLLTDIGTDLTRNFVKERITGPLSDLAGKALGDGGALGGLLGSKGGQLGSTAMNPLYVRLADSLGGLGSAVTGGSSDGGLLGSLGSVVGLFGGVGAQASVASALPGDSLDNLFRLTNNFAKFDGGGYTGPGGKYDPAGIVHAGEYVMTAESTKSLGVDFLNRLNKRGYADGGYVGAIMGGRLSGAPSASGPAVVVHNNFTVGDVASMDQVRREVRGSEARIVGGLRRNRTYGGEAST